MPTSIELRQERARIVETLRGITSRAEEENRDLNGEELQSYNRGEEDFRSITARIERQDKLEQIEADQARSINDREQIPGGNRDVNDAGGNEAENRSRDQRSAFLRFVRSGRSALSPEQRSLVENTAGEILVPEELESEILRSLPTLTVVRDLASTRRINTNRVRRRSLDEVSVGWGKLETGDQTLTDSMPGTPDEEFTYVEDLYGLAKVGEDEFDDTDVNLEAFIRDSFSRAIGEAEDTAFTVGTGHAAKMPVGIFSTAGGVPVVTSGATTYGTTGVNAPSVLLDDLKELIYTVPAQYRRNGSFLTASTTELAISQIKDADGRYLWQPSLQAGRPNTFMGYALHNQEDVAGIAAGAKIASFGDYNAGYRVYDRLGMTIQRLVELYAEQGMVGFKVRFRVGGDVVKPDAMRVLATAAV